MANDTPTAAIANPAPLGLLAFGMTTVLLALHNLGLFPADSAIMSMGIFYGGLAQVIAGIFEFKRRTLPTILITKYNVDPKTLQSILGHSNISTTLGYYTMVDDKQRRKALELYGDAIRNGDRKDDDDPEDRVESANCKIEIKQITGSEDVGFIVVKKRPC